MHVTLQSFYISPFIFIGEYVVTVKFNDEHIPDSPFRVPVVPSSGEARKVTVEALKQKGLEVINAFSYS